MNRPKAGDITEHYGSYANQPGGFAPDAQNEIYLRRRGEKTAIRKIGMTAGICVIAYVALQNILSLPVVFSPALAQLYKDSNTFFYILTMFMSVATILIPFIIGGNYLRKKTGADIYYLDAPKDTLLAVFSIPLGLLICLIGNYLTGLFVYGAEQIGFKLTSPDFSTPTDITDRILYVLAIAVIPALAEELSIRGCILQPLRRYGDMFAILASSMIFAVLHGNLIQAPFAFIAGIGLGYICCITGSLWPGIIVHFINNAYSCAEEFITADVTDEKLQYIILNGLQAAFIGAGIVGAIAFFVALKGRKPEPSHTVIRGKEKAAAFILNIPMIIALIIMLFITAQYVSRA